MHDVLVEHGNLAQGPVQSVLCGSRLCGPRMFSSGPQLSVWPQLSVSHVYCNLTVYGMPAPGGGGRYEVRAYIGLCSRCGRVTVLLTPPVFLPGL